MMGFVFSSTEYHTENLGCKEEEKWGQDWGSHKL